MGRKRRGRTDVRVAPLTTRMWQSAPTWTSIIALIVAVGSLFMTLRSDARDKEQWMLLNTPRVRIKSIEFVPLAVMSSDSVERTNWGYVPFTLPEYSDEGLPTGRTRLLSRLVIAGPDGEPVPMELAPLLTRADAAREAERRGMDPFQASKEIRFHVAVRNDGVLPIERSQTEILYVESGDSTIVQRSFGTQTIFGQQEVLTRARLFLRPDVPTPDTLRFLMRSDFETLGRKLTMRAQLTFIASEAGWQILDGQLRDAR